MYSRSPLLLLDDVFSALDHATAHAIFINLFGDDGLLKQGGKAAPTTLLATHSSKFHTTVVLTNCVQANLDCLLSVEFLSAADKVVVIDNSHTAITEETAVVIQKMKEKGLLTTSDEVSLKREEEIPPIMIGKEDSERDDVDKLQAKKSLGGSLALYRILMDGVPLSLFACFLFVVMWAGFLESGISRLIPFCPIFCLMLMKRDRHFPSSLGRSCTD